MMISTLDLAEIMSMHIATAVTLCLAFIALYYIVAVTDDNLDDGKWWGKVNILPYNKDLYRLMLLAPNVIFFWWLFEQNVSGWWYVTLLLTISASNFILRTIIRIIALFVLILIRSFRCCNILIDKLQNKLKTINIKI